MRTGFIGLGAMGSSMARNLHRAGLLCGVWNRDTAKAQQLAAELGCVAALSAAALARECDAVVICVSADQDVLALIASVAPELRAGSLVIDCTTTGADTAGAAEFLRGGECRFAFVEARQERSFAQRAEAIGLRYTAGPRLDAINISNGQPVTIAVYRSADPS